MVHKVLEYYATEDGLRDIMKCRVTCEKIRNNRLACDGCENSLSGVGKSVGFDYEYVSDAQMDEFERIVKEKTRRV